MTPPFRNIARAARCWTLCCAVFWLSCDASEQGSREQAALSASASALTVPALYGSALVLLADAAAKPLAPFGLGVYRAVDGDFAALGDVHASTLILPPATLVRLCHGDDEDDQADCKEARNTKLKPILLDLTKSGFDQALRYMEVAPLALLYPGLDFQGIPQALRYGKHPANKGHLDVVGNDMTRSVYIPPGVNVKLCPHEPEVAPNQICYHWDRPIANVNGLYPSYAEVVPTVTAFDGTNARGKFQSWMVDGNDRMDAVLGALADTGVASIIIPPELKALLCDHADGTGTCQTFARSQLTLTEPLLGKVAYVAARLP